MTKADVLREAADLLEEHGWCQRAYARTPSGDAITDPVVDGRWDEPVAGYCLMGAVVAVSGDMDLLDNVYDDYFAEVAQEIDCDCWSGYHDRVTDWNDEKGRTRDDVTGLLRRVAGKLEAGR